MSFMLRTMTCTAVLLLARGTATSFMRGTMMCTAVLLLFACDPVQRDAIAALGGETGGHPGPQHRPGQPCLLCHDGALGDPTEFSIAGTVFLRPTGTEPAQGATVELKAADGASFEVVTNRAGNFYVSPGQFSPMFPLQTTVAFRGQNIAMLTNIGRDGSCAGCHFQPAGPSSPGQVYVELQDGGVPP